MGIAFLASTMLSTSPQFLTAQSYRYFVFTLLAAGAAYIQNNVFLGVNSDKVSTLKGQVARWKKHTQKKQKTKRKPQKEWMRTMTWQDSCTV